MDLEDTVSWLDLVMGCMIKEKVIEGDCGKTGCPAAGQSPGPSV